MMTVLLVALTTVGQPTQSPWRFEPGTKLVCETTVAMNGTMPSGPQLVPASISSNDRRVLSMAPVPDGARRVHAGNAVLLLTEDRQLRSHDHEMGGSGRYDSSEPLAAASRPDQASWFLAREARRVVLDRAGEVQGATWVRPIETIVAAAQSAIARQEGTTPDSAKRFEERLRADLRDHVLPGRLQGLFPVVRGDLNQPGSRWRSSLRMPSLFGGTLAIERTWRVVSVADQFTELVFVDDVSFEFPPPARSFLEMLEYSSRGAMRWSRAAGHPLTFTRTIAAQARVRPDPRTPWSETAVLIEIDQNWRQEPASPALP